MNVSVQDLLKWMLVQWEMQSCASALIMTHLRLYLPLHAEDVACRLRDVDCVQ